MGKARQARAREAFKTTFLYVYSILVQKRFSYLKDKMKKTIFFLLGAVLAVVEARPGYVLVPIDSLPYYQPYQMAGQPAYYPRPQYLYRGVRSALEEERIIQRQQRQRDQQQTNRRDGVVEDPAPAFAIPAGIRQAEDAVASGSTPSAYGGQGPDYVDYGAYTGGYGAFGWYTDHPVLIH